MLITHLSFGGSEPEVYENIRQLKSDTDAINRDEREIFPLVANKRQSIPSEEETVQQSNDVRDA